MAATRKGAKGKQPEKSQKSKARKRNFDQEDRDEKASAAPQEKKQNFLDECKEEFKTTIEEKFGLLFPDDFFWFYSFIKNQADGFLEDLELQLTGPYHMLNGNIKKDTDLSSTKLNLHGRYFVDTPEVNTVLYSTQDSDDLHIAYYRDSPTELPSLMVCCKNNQSGELNQYGDNIFGAISLYIKEKLKRTKDKSKTQKLKTHLEAIEKQAEKHGLSLEANPPSLKKRAKLTVTKSFNKVGLVVPLDDSGVGYREIRHSDKELKKVLTRIVDATNNDDEDTRNKYLDELQETITFIQFANDECDYGMGLEFGIDLFVFANENFHGMIEHVLPLAYRLLKRDLFADILEAHLEERRRKGPISVL